MGISFQDRHYDHGGSVTAPEYCSSWRYLQDQGGLLKTWSYVPFLWRLEISYRGAQKGLCLVSDSLEKRSP